MRTKDFVSPAVLAQINKTEEQSEILISAIQAGFVLMMATFYFLAPKGYDTAVTIRPVPLVLGIYAPFVITRLILALLRRLSPVMLNVSIVIDIAMICVLLWTFPLQYDEAPGLYLKAPSAMYLFIFVALRSLRYDHRYVIFAGATAVVGWMALTIYAIQVDGSITHDFADYMTSTKVLVGAQVDRIIAIIVITVILALSVRRSGALLARSAEEGEARQQLSRYFAREVVTRILDSQDGFQPGDGEVHTAATLMVDIRGFSAWAETIDPKTVMHVLADYQSRVVPIIMYHGGSIDKFMGDGVLCHFGAASPSSTCHADALRAAEDIRQMLVEWKEELSAEEMHGFEFGIGVAAGRLIFGAVGEQDRLEFTVIGSPVNTCAKLEKHTKAVGAHILVPLDIYTAARRQGFEPRLDFKKAMAQEIEGITEPMDLALVLRDADSTGVAPE